jgi:hypothetical protein
MTQIFTPAADTKLRAALLVVCVATVGAFLVIGGHMASSYLTLIGWVRDQPVPFSHQHHVGELGIDCRYCHTGVEYGARAGLPSTHICMTCHSQIWTGAPMLAPVRRSLAENKPLVWNRVTSLPDYVYFNHSIHIARGVPCETCHGRIDEMPLTMRAQPFEMRWCLSCHTNPAPELRPVEEVTRMDWTDWKRHPKEHELFGAVVMRLYHVDPSRLTDCNVCHR